jgi:hypothetical protein
MRAEKHHRDESSEEAALGYERAESEPANGDHENT